MTIEGIEAVFLETHNWGKSAKFFQELATKSSSRRSTTPANCAAVTSPTCSSLRFQRPSPRADTSCWRWPTPTPSGSKPLSTSSADGRTPIGAQG
jgi:hypothetical protein